MRALHLKLNELIAAVEGASNRLIDVEDLSDREVEQLYERYQCLATTAAKVSRGAKLSVESAEADRHSKTKHTDAEKAQKRPVPVKREAADRKRSKH